MVKPILKSIGAVLAGLLTVVVLSMATDFILDFLGIFPAVGQGIFLTWMLALALFYRCVYAFAGGYVTARLAPSKPMLHAVILAIIGTILGIVGAIANWDKSAAWYPISLVILSLICVLLGAKLVRAK